MKTRASSKTLSLALILALLLTSSVPWLAFPQTAHASFAEGNGSEGNPWIVMTPEQLHAIRGNLGGHYRLGANIDLTEYLSADGDGYNGGLGWEPIGTTSTPFTGSLDGNGYEIRGLIINRTTNGIGLFGQIGGTGQARNVSLVDVNVSGNQWVGGLVGRLIGGSISNSYVEGQIDGMISVGGLVGLSFGGSISYSGAEGSVDGGYDSVGGLVGYNYGGAINHSYATNTVSGTNESVGGLVGSNHIGDDSAGGEVIDSYATGNVTGYYSAGGLVGYNNEGSIRQSYATGNVQGNQNVGGLAGQNLGTIEKSYATGNVSGAQLIGGLAGYQGDDSSITFSYATGDVEGDEDVGGLVGQLFGVSSSVSYSYSTGRVTGIVDYYGGLVGWNWNFDTVTNSFYDSETSGQSGNDNGEPKTTAEMKDAATFKSAGWDFDTIWGIHPNVNNGYPFLVPPYTVLYSGNGNTAGAPPIDSGLYLQGESVEVLGNTGGLEKDGYAFNGWNTSADGLGAAYAVGAELPMGIANVVLYAQWVDDSEPDITIDMRNVDDSIYTNDTWTNQAVTVNVSASDTGSGLSALEYSEDEEASWETYVGALVYSLPGVHSLHVRATNGNGNAWTLERIVRIDQTLPNIQFGTNGNAVPSASASTTVTVSDEDSGVNASSLAFAWSTSLTPPPIEEWTAFESGDTLIKDNAAGDWYLHIRAADLAGNSADAVSGVFKLHSSSSGGGIWLPSVSDKEAAEALLLTDSLVLDKVQIEKEIQPDGSVREIIALTEQQLREALAAVKDKASPVLTIEFDNSERVVQVRLPAAPIAAAAKLTNAVIEIKLNEVSYRLAIRVLDLEALAARLGARLQDLTVNVVLERAEQAVESEVERLAVSEGFQLAGPVFGFKVIVEADGKSLEIDDFGGAYLLRAIVVNADAGKQKLTGALYDPESSAFAFVPSQFGVRDDGTAEMAMKSPHNSLYTVLAWNGRAFDDMNGHWAAADVGLLSSKLIVKGVSSERFAPETSITRAEFAALLVRALGLAQGRLEQPSRFADVSTEAWYAKPIEAAVKAGLVSGMSPERFAPSDLITREQMAVMVANALAFAGESPLLSVDLSVLERFKDHEDISSWAKTSMAIAVQAGIVGGMGEDGVIAPSEHATRAQAAAMLRRLLKQLSFMD